MATRIYLAGPITGHPDHKAAFARAAEAIHRGGCEPVNPADLDLTRKALDLAQAWIDKEGSDDHR